MARIKSSPASETATSQPAISQPESPVKREYVSYVPLEPSEHPLLVIGFKAEAAETYATPIFDSGYQDSRHDKAIEKKRQTFAETAWKLPYVSTLVEIGAVVSDRKGQACVMFDSQPGSPAVLKFREWLLRVFPDTWRNDFFGPSVGGRAASQPMLCGFEIGRFKCLAGIECVKYGYPLPLGFWHFNPDHRELRKFLLQDLDSFTTELSVPFAMLGEFAVPDNFEGGRDAPGDLAMACRVLQRFGLMPALPVPV